MGIQITNYQCPACTGPLQFDATSGKLVCEYCGSTYDVAEIEALYAPKEAQAQEAFAEASEQHNTTETDQNTSAEQEISQDGMRTYSCPSCGAELICDETTVATSCPYCNNPTVVPGQLIGTFKPDYVIPFTKDKKAAIATLEQYYKGKFLLPKAFSDHNHIEKIQGIYVPFWLFDTKVNAVCEYSATRIHTRRQGDFDIITTDHFNLYREGNMAFERLPIDASSKMPDDFMDSISPFDYASMKPFSTAYLPGYLAEKYDVDVDSCAPRAEENCTQTAVQALTQTTCTYQGVVCHNKDVNLEHGKVQYAMLPV